MRRKAAPTHTCHAISLGLRAQLEKMPVFPRDKRLFPKSTSPDFDNGVIGSGAKVQIGTLNSSYRLAILDEFYALPRFANSFELLPLHLAASEARSLPGLPRDAEHSAPTTSDAYRLTNALSSQP
jgi:hypothetical protein